ncbi:nicotinate-nucleotide adenylyltransferase [Candidatus Pantoea multigeneris]|uniref:Probable nicotinate-nucleotide adenylyltransferase n=1 Tax=Candidatus Pantoea multigeneris TaxID=2608357 RepID=A0ABX0RCC0_9GAMM|nr:nicotinate-nucleotide adenylyltransferase [Pantoea multigeneris]NIF23001.1 nicotinate-nucleotide adenylyltransferase [Pantoea multigeneris]
MSELFALFGGTFDPIHYGHLHPVMALAGQTGLQKVTLLPNNVPPHRPQPEATALQRVAMLERAIADLPLFEIDTRELDRETPSWTVATLEALRAERGPHQPLGFIIGQDSLLSLSKWHRWQDLLSLCHLLVCQRPGYATQMETPEMQQWLMANQAQDIQQLHQTPAGYVWLADTPLVNISATEIRQRRHQGRSCSDLLPAAVIDYIDAVGLYRD